MSETNNKNPAIACGNMKINQDVKELTIEQGTYGPSKNEVNSLVGMEIPMEDATITNETPDGKSVVIDTKTGNVIAHIEADGTLSKKLAEKDKEEKNKKQETER